MFLTSPFVRYSRKGSLSVKSASRNRCLRGDNFCRPPLFRASLVHDKKKYLFSDGGDVRELSLPRAAIRLGSYELLPMQRGMVLPDHRSAQPELFLGRIPFFPFNPSPPVADWHYIPPPAPIRSPARATSNVHDDLFFPSSGLTAQQA